MLTKIDEYRSQVASAANQYRLAKLRRETLEDSLTIEEIAYNNLLVEVGRAIPAELLSRWKRSEQQLNQVKTGLEDAKKLEKTSKEELVSTIREAVDETGAEGRELHPSVNIAFTNEVRLPHDLGPFISWLVQQGRREDINVKIYKLDFYRMHRDNGTLPEGVELVLVPLIRVDSDFE